MSERPAVESFISNVRGIAADSAAVAADLSAVTNWIRILEIEKALLLRVVMLVLEKLESIDGLSESDSNYIEELIAETKKREK